MSTGTRVEIGSSSSPTGSVEFAVGGMTCASCAARIEKKLNRLDGVHASVNFATETATVRYDAGEVSPEDLIATVAATGYTARLPEPPQAEAGVSTDVAERGQPDETDRLRQRLIVSALLTAPVVVLAMVPARSSGFGSGSRSLWPGRWWSGGRGRSTAPRRSTRGTAPRRWTR